MNLSENGTGSASRDITSYNFNVFLDFYIFHAQVQTVFKSGLAPLRCARDPGPELFQDVLMIHFKLKKSKQNYVFFIVFHRFR